MGRIAKELTKDLADMRAGRDGFSESPLGDRGEARRVIKSLADLPPVEDLPVPEPKQGVSIRLSPRVLRYFRGKDPKGYQRRIHAVLEAYVATHPPMPTKASRRRG